ncbi:aldo/keto reductase [Christiangramia sp. SM2212]|uniref:Aldo/keto reductase n=1 Tax=Christiangramia sediminicola TaxID=3073267 RepID=A0ABU1ENY0_9FLAO|nr:aldo/keto reductase [Christiangramia sp. SM2212]MDR5590096.1 aldo/keto reductase [Christiangramia sp. SM2212]
MELRRLGNTDLKTAPIVFGGNVFGWTTNEKESFDLLDEFLDMGFNMIDTADVYSKWADGNKGGESESIIGKHLKIRGNRHKIVLATKVGSSMKQGGNSNLSKAYILNQVEESLRRLQTDHIDLYFTHKDDENTPIEETLEAYEKLIDQGKVRYIGASNLSASRLKNSLEISEKENLPKYEVFQPEYSLVNRKDFEGEILKICKDHHLGVTSYFSLASGFLTGKYSSKKEISGSSREMFLKDYFDDRGQKILADLKDISDHRNKSQAGIALRWIIQRPGITAPIASTTNSEQFTSFKEAISFELSRDEMEKLNQASS